MISADAVREAEDSLLDLFGDLLAELDTSDPTHARMQEVVSATCIILGMPLDYELPARWIRWMIDGDQMMLATLSREQLVEAVALTLAQSYLEETKP